LVWLDKEVRETILGWLLYEGGRSHEREAADLGRIRKRGKKNNLD